MTEKTMLEQIRSLAQAAVNADDDQEQFSNLMRIIELTETDNPPFAVGEYYSYKSMENVLHILKITAVMGDIVEAGFLDTETGKLINTRIELDKKYVQPATTEQIAEFKRAEQFAKHGRKLDEFRVGDLFLYLDKVCLMTTVNDKQFSFGMIGSDRQVFLNYPNDFKYCTLIQTAEELQERISSEKMG